MIEFGIETVYRPTQTAFYHCQACNGRWEALPPGQCRYMVNSKGEIKEQIHMWCPHCGTLDRLEDINA